jgi:hypothetical protein
MTCLCQPSKFPFWDKSGAAQGAGTPPYCFLKLASGQYSTDISPIGFQKGPGQKKGEPRGLTIGFLKF